MKHGRKALCLLLALALLLGCLPAAGAVSAREAEPWRTMCGAAESSEENSWRTLCAATEGPEAGAWRTLCAATEGPEAGAWRTLCAATGGLKLDGRPADPAAVCTVRFDLNGYGPDAPAAQTVTKGQPAVDPGFTDYTDGMLFDGWYTEPACVNLYDFSAPVNNNLTLYASYVRGHVVHFEPNGATEGGMEDVYVKHGEAFELPECGFLYAGKAFDDWTISGISGEFDPGYPIAVFQNLTVTAAWKTARISFYANGGGGYMSSVNCPIGGLYTLPACKYSPPVGKHFAGWDLGQPGEVVVIYGDHVLSALWDENVYAVHFEANGGSGSMSDLVVSYGSRLVLPDCGFSPPEGQTLCKWSIPDAAEPWEYFYVGQETVVKSDLTVYAQWTPTDTETCTVTFQSNGGSGSMASLTVEKGCSFTLPYCSFSPPDGRLFRYWMDEASSYNPGTVISINHDMTFSAFWRQATYYTVSFDVQGHGATPDSQRILHGEKAIRPPDPVEEGWTFIDWYENTNFVYFFDFSEAIHGNRTAYAYWKQTVYSLHLETDGNGSAEFSAEEATMDTEITVTVTPEEGYVIDRITYTPAGGETVDFTSTGNFTMPPANVAVAVSFKPIETVSYPITLEVVGSGWAGLSEEEAEPWQRITVQTAAYGGAALLRVLLITEDGTERDITERMGFNMPEGPVAVRVEFEAIPHHLTLEVGPGGTANLSAETAPEGEEITVTTTPNSGFRLKSILVYPDERTTPCSGAQCAPSARSAQPDGAPACSGAQCAPGARSAQPDGACTESKEIPWRTMCAATGMLAQTGTDITETGRFQMPAYDVKVVVVFEELPPVPVYSLRLEVGPGGTAALSAYEAEAGTEITVSTAPDRGRAVQAIRVKTESGSVTDVTAAGRFSMPAENVAVEVVFAWVNPFVDVSEADWFYIPVLWAYYNEPQITAGTDPTHFSPGNTVTRAEAMVFFWAANGHPEPETTKSPFKDVKKSHWAFKAVMWAVENGITGGTDAEGKYFSPARTCTRSEILQFLYAAMGKPEYHIANPYSDVKNKHWYKDGAIWAYEYGLERGENGKFHATTPCTRASVVTYLYRYFTGELLDED